MLLKNKRFTAKVVFIIITAFVLILSIILISETKTHYYVFLADDDTECIINNVPYVTQENVLPSGCESACAVMVLQYNGFDIELTDFANNYLDKKEIVYDDKGKMHNASPYEYFIGNPNDYDSYGCYAPVIVNAVNKAVKSTDYHCENTSGESLDYLMQKYVSNNIPVLIWVTINMREPNKGDSWYLENGEVFVWTAGEHCMVLVGEDDSGYYLLDPYKSNGLVRHEKSVAQTRYNQMGSQSAVLLK